MDRGFERVWSEFGALRSDIAASNRQLAQVGWGLAAVFAAQLIGGILILALR